MDSPITSKRKRRASIEYDSQFTDLTNPTTPFTDPVDNFTDDDLPESVNLLPCSTLDGENKTTLAKGSLKPDVEEHPRKRPKPDTLSVSKESIVVIHYIFPLQTSCQTTHCSWILNSRTVRAP